MIQVDARKGNLYLNWHKLSGSKDNVKDESKYYKLKKLKSMKGVWTDISLCLDFENNRIDAWVDGKNVVKIFKSPIFLFLSQFTLNTVYISHLSVTTHH